ncbi:MAG: tRNA dihydrouridine synthase DusB [Oscillospiraceae bacterium]
MVKIGNVEIAGKLTLAPMAGVTDAAFRAVCRAQGAALTCTEMVSAKALVYKDEKTKSLLWMPEDEHPAAAQIFGHEPDVMAEAAPMALALSGADILDINMGCPVGKVIRSGDGSALMRDPELAGRIIEAVVQAVDVPVTVKFRKGWDGGNLNAVEFARVCEQAGAAAVAVHGRTRVQMYSGRADWDVIRDVKRAVTIPVIANGDIFSGVDAAHILRYTGADLAMVGRGAFGDPWLFARGNAAIAGLPEPELPPLRARIDTAVQQIEAAAEQKGERLACLEARSQFCWYLRGVPHAGYYKQQIVHVSTLDELRQIAKDMQRDLRDAPLPAERDSQ